MTPWQWFKSKALTVLATIGGALMLLGVALAVGLTGRSRRHVLSREAREQEQEREQESSLAAYRKAREAELAEVRAEIEAVERQKNVDLIALETGRRLTQEDLDEMRARREQLEAYITEELEGE